jgi:Tfp pilus assembly protein PilO
MKEKPVLILFAITAIVILAAYFVFFAPVIGKLKTKHLEYKSLENELLRARDTIKYAQGTLKEKTLLTAADIPVVIDELARRGKLTGVNLISIRPREMVGADKAGPEYDIMPIDMEIESTYEQIGAFLGSLDKLQKGLIKVKSFDIVPGREYPGRLTTKLVADVYFAKRELNAE